jgi:hypothetical protein
VERVPAQVLQVQEALLLSEQEVLVQAREQVRERAQALQQALALALVEVEAQVQLQQQAEVLVQPQVESQVQKESVQLEPRALDLSQLKSQLLQLKSRLAQDLEQWSQYWSLGFERSSFPKVMVEGKQLQLLSQMEKVMDSLMQLEYHSEQLDWKKLEFEFRKVLE